MPTRSYIRPVSLNESSPFLGDQCALCKEPFTAGATLVICPQDGSRHHRECWEANGSKCTAFGCQGAGEVVLERRVPLGRPGTPPAVGAQNAGRLSKVRTMPEHSVGCARTCLLLSIALAIVLIAAGCFGMWAIADYILIDRLGWQYRAPFTGTILLPWLITTTHAVRLLLGV